MLYSVHTDDGERKCCTVFIQMAGKGNAVQCSYRWQGKEMLYSVHTDDGERKCSTVFIQMAGKGNAVVFIQMAGKGNDVQTMFMKIVGPKVSERKGCTNCVRTLRCVLFLFFL